MAFVQILILIHNVRVFMPDSCFLLARSLLCLILNLSLHIQFMFFPSLFFSYFVNCCVNVNKFMHVPAICFLVSDVSKNN